MFKLAAATVLCSLGLSLCSDLAQAGCCRRTSTCCCNPAPTCCAPGSSSAAPMPASDAPAPPYDANPAPPPAPSASTSPGGSPVAMTPNASGRQTYRSFSYDAAPTNPGYYAAPQPATRSSSPDRVRFRADRKLLGNY